MSEGALIEDPAAALRYVFGGKAIVTLRSKRTGVRFTYRISKSDDGKVFFVHLMNGPDNTADYQFLGTIFPDALFDLHKYRHGKKSRIRFDAPSAKAFDWAFEGLVAKEIHPKLEVWHEGSCARCGRRLTTPESIARGLGPECAAMAEGG